eukprot:scaffold14555_cov29-Tisochrysis_lutea.AAC.2
MVRASACTRREAASLPMVDVVMWRAEMCSEPSGSSVRCVDDPLLAHHVNRYPQLDRSESLSARGGLCVCVRALVCTCACVHVRTCACVLRACEKVSRLREVCQHGAVERGARGRKCPVWPCHVAYAPVNEGEARYAA